MVYINNATYISFGLAATCLDVIGRVRIRTFQRPAEELADQREEKIRKN